MSEIIFYRSSSVLILPTTSLTKLTKQKQSLYVALPIFVTNQDDRVSGKYFTESARISATAQATEDHAGAIERERDRYAREQQVEDGVAGVHVRHSPDQQPDCERTENGACDDDPMNDAHRTLAHGSPAFRACL